MTQIVPIINHTASLGVEEGERALTRFWEFFVSSIRNRNTRRANSLVSSGDK
jgi:hypothetical protein